MVIRLASKRDANAIAILHANSWNLAYRGIFSNEYLDGPVEKERLTTWKKRFLVPSKQQLVWVAEDDDKILMGFICLFLNSDPVWGTLIDNLHIRGDLKRKGMGTSLMEWAAKWLLINESDTKIYLWVLEKNNRARVFYDALQGKSVETRLELQADGSRVPAIRYTWESPQILLEEIHKKNNFL